MHTNNILNISKLSEKRKFLKNKNKNMMNNNMKNHI